MIADGQVVDSITLAMLTLFRASGLDEESSAPTHDSPRAGGGDSVET